MSPSLRKKKGQEKDEEDSDESITLRRPSRRVNRVSKKSPESPSRTADVSHEDSHHGAPRSPGNGTVGAKAQWLSDDEDVYEKFKLSKKRKTHVKSVAPTTSGVVKASAPRKNKKKPGDPGRKKDQRDDIECMPDYFSERRKAFDKQQDQNSEGNRGLRIPPSYTDVEFSDDERLADLDERPNFPPTMEASRPYADIELPKSAGIIPASIAQYLRDYQVQGVEFLHELFVYQRGGILGDDMGLGKTVQVIAFLTVAFGKTGDQRDAKRMRKMRRSPHKPWYPRILVVCPGSLIENWRQEFTRWGWWHVDKFHGNTKLPVHQAALSGRLEVVITTYTTYKIGKSELNMIAWDCVIADECHLLKEKSSEITKAMNEVNALCRIGLTGTAIQNRYEELWTLLNWTNPGKFGSMSTWVTSISGPLRIGQSHDATLYQLKRARVTAKRLVHNLLPQFFLRRMKSLIAHQLPKKIDRIVFCPLSDIQRAAYEQFLGSVMVQAVKKSSEFCDCKSGKKAGWCCYMFLPHTKIKWQALVFPVIMTLQKLSNHLALVIPHSDDSDEKQKRDLECLQLLMPDRWRTLYAKRDSLVNMANPDFCGKWKILKELLKFWHENGDKVLIFSNSVKLLKMLEHLFRNTSYSFCFLSGSMTYEDRQKTVDQFNTSPNEFVFLISTKAGGVGLNITSANKVVVFDPNWNPSHDLQAQDRAYRIGQTRDVEVYRLVSAGTVEEIVYARQIYKQQQANICYNASTERRYFKGVQNAKDRKGEIFGLSNLLTFHADNVILRDIVNQTNIAEARRGVDILDLPVDDAPDALDVPASGDPDVDDESALSHLAALLIDEESPEDRSTRPGPPKTDAIQAILASAGVTYTHENSEVVGSSRVETELSRRAEETGNDAHDAGIKMFTDSPQGPGKSSYIFRPPPEVMRRQFCTMAKDLGYPSAEAFGLEVENWTQKQRTDCLERFYLKRREYSAGSKIREEEPVDAAAKETECEYSQDEDEDNAEDDSDEL